MEKVNFDWVKIGAMQSALETLRAKLYACKYDLYYSVNITSYGGMRVFISISAVDGSPFGVDVYTESVSDALGKGAKEYEEMFTKCESFLSAPFDPLQKEKNELLARLKEIEELQKNGK